MVVSFWSLQLYDDYVPWAPGWGCSDKCHNKSRSQWCGFREILAFVAHICSALFIFLGFLSNLFWVQYWLLFYKNKCRVEKTLEWMLTGGFWVFWLQILRPDQCSQHSYELSSFRTLVFMSAETEAEETAVLEITHLVHINAFWRLGNQVSRMIILY